MSLSEAMRDEGILEQCLDELGESVAALEHYPVAVLAIGLRVHLEALLQALLDAELCTRAEVREFIRGLEQETLQYEDE
ncbi:MAG: hypothetical protein JSR36_09865 [Proteobacteria bacterium]|nr:hypothetical protein [Pseudomonadota bacterium]